METLWVITLVTIPHLVGTILLGLLMGIIGFKLSASNGALMEAVAPAMFILLGFIYIYKNYGVTSHHHGADISSPSNRSKRNVITLMTTELFFSPGI